MMDDHEWAFLTAFVEAEKRSRYLGLLASPKRRKKALNRLNHRSDIDLSHAEPLPSATTAAELERILKARGAGPSCHLIADASDLDGRMLPLDEALGYALGHGFGIVVSCVPGRLAIYKPEAPSGVYLLERR